MTFWRRVIIQKWLSILCTPTEGALHPHSERASILKAALQRRRISKVLPLFKGGIVFDALHRMVRYFQTKVSSAVQIAVIVPLPYLQAVPKHSNGARVRYIRILKVLIFRRWHFKGVVFWRHFSYSKAAQYLMHSYRGCATSRRVSIARAFSTVGSSDELFPNDFGKDLLLNPKPDTNSTHGG